jgi:hypothetical protein
MANSFSKFKTDDLLEMGISLKRKLVFNGNIPPVEPSDYLKITIAKNLKKNLASEKAKSEFLIAPVIAEIAENNESTISFYSGYQFDVDKSKGLSGFCDFIISAEPQAYTITAPIFCIVEAKNDNLDFGLPQCIAEMYAAVLFNQRHEKNITTIYGVVTFGFQWQFVRFANMQADVDETIYYINDLPKILGILQYIVSTQSKF